MNNMPLGIDSPVGYPLGAFDNREQFQPKTFLGKLINCILLYFFPLPEELKAPDKKVYQVYELVHNTLEKLRESRPESVETIGQLQSLDRLAKYLDRQKTPSNMAMPKSTSSHHVVKGTSIQQSPAMASNAAKSTKEITERPTFRRLRQRK